MSAMTPGDLVDLTCPVCREHELRVRRGEIECPGGCDRHELVEEVWVVDPEVGAALLGWPGERLRGDVLEALDGDTVALEALERSAQGVEADVLPLLAPADLLALPEPSWLVDGLVPAEGLSVLYGAPSSAKTFLALDWALSVAAGLSWLGHDVQRCWVVYVAGEGAHGLARRYRAWLSARQLEAVERVRFIVGGSVNLLDSRTVERARRTLETLPERPGLLVVDTVARAMAGGDENAAKDVGRFVEAVDALRDGGAALVVHHSGHEHDRERGSSALGAAADARLQLAREGRAMRVQLTNPKQKDAAEARPIDLRLEAHAGSLALALVSPLEGVADACTLAEDVERRVLAYVEANAPSSKRAVRSNVEGRNADVDQALSRLEEQAKVRSTPKGWEPCPGISGTLGHGDSRASSGTVPPAGVCPVGAPHRGTVCAPASNGCAPPRAPGLKEGELVNRLRTDFGARLLDADREPLGPRAGSPPRTRPRPGGCECRSPARSPRAEGADLCQNCKRPMPGAGSPA